MQRRARWAALRRLVSTAIGPTADCHWLPFEDCSDCGSIQTLVPSGLVNALPNPLHVLYMSLDRNLAVL